MSKEINYKSGVFLKGIATIVALGEVFYWVVASQLVWEDWRDKMNSRCYDLCGIGIDISLLFLPPAILGIIFIIGVFKKTPIFRKSYELIIIYGSLIGIFLYFLYLFKFK